MVVPSRWRYPGVGSDRCRSTGDIPLFHRAAERRSAGAIA
jgi:hypothetical protein